MTDGGPIDVYVAALRSALRGPGRVKRDLLAEARDGLLDAAEAYECDGLPRAEAERRAVADFGPVAEIAPGFQQELAVGQGRRTALLLFLSVPPMTLMWNLVWKIFPEPPSVMAAKPAWFGVLARVVDYSQLLTGVVGALALLALGRGLRRLHRPALITRSLGLLVWLGMPVLVAMCAALSFTRGTSDIMDELPGIALTIVSYAIWLWQLRSATLCLRFASPAALSAADRARSRSYA
ncbi:permease prefix domain 1-containing protein [Sphaerimonospora mesophila]|uniref:permease prefix domain 1-containing protein n=1 Tax=Sphaerimonospora mesophila TaxID=37483 RepID=UPI0007C72DE2